MLLRCCICTCKGHKGHYSWPEAFALLALREQLRSCHFQDWTVCLNEVRQLARKRNNVTLDKAVGLWTFWNVIGVHAQLWDLFLSDAVPQEHFKLLHVGLTGAQITQTNQPQKGHVGVRFTDKKPVVCTGSALPEDVTQRT